MLRSIWFHAHWLVGITAGIVLMVVGITGGMLSFEQEILRWINRGVITVAPPAGGAPLEPHELAERVHRDFPERRINGITVHADPRYAAVVNLAAMDPGNRRGENFYVDPYTGALLGDPRGQEFFGVVMRLHRWLLTDALLGSRDVGKHIVGASTILFMILACSGLYLRWPGRRHNWRAWFVPNLKLKGRGFLWDLHAVVGTWLVPFYLLAALTGLYWSYDGYRDVLHQVSGVPRMTRPAAPAPSPSPQVPASMAAGAETVRTGERPARTGPMGGRERAPGMEQRRGPEAGERRGAGTGERRAGPGSRESTDTAPPQPAVQPPPTELLRLAWPLFRSTSEGNYSRVMLRLPAEADRPLTAMYLAASPPHERAFNRLTIDPQSVAVTDHDRYADRPLAARLMGSMLPLHSGSFFGLIGRLLMMVASLAVPLFTITGWLLYLDRRRKQKAARAAAAAATRPGGAGSAVEPPPAHRWRRHPVVIALAVIALLAGATVLTARHLAGARGETPVLQYTEAHRGSIEDLVAATGILQPRDYVDVGAQVSGQVHHIHVVVGDEVRAGDLLAEIDPTLFAAKVDASRAQLRYQRAQLQDRKAQLRLAEYAFERQTNLMAEQATTTEALQNAEASLLSARAQIEMLEAQIDQTESTVRSDEANLQYARIHAPMAGTVVSISARQGQTLNASQQAPTILRIADLGTMTVQTQVSEADISRLSVGMPAYFSTLGSQGRRWHGTLHRIEPTPTVENNVVLYNALFDVDNGNTDLLPQMTAQVFFVVAAARDALLVPAAAVGALAPTAEGQGDGGGGRRAGEAGRTATVQVRQSDGTLGRREVTVGVSNRIYTQILSGLAEGEAVAVGLQTGRSDRAGNARTAPGNPLAGGPGMPRMR